MPKKVDSVCADCGITHQVLPATIEAGNGKLCRRCITIKAGRACRAIHSIAGDKNCNWKGGITYDLPAWKSKWVKEYRKKNPESQKARDAVKYALVKGEIIKTNCSTCGSIKDIQGHHHKGYAKEFWLVVTWLCRTCHNKVHGKLKPKQPRKAV